MGQKWKYDLLLRMNPENSKIRFTWVKKIVLLKISYPEENEAYSYQASNTRYNNSKNLTQVV